MSISYTVPSFASNMWKLYTAKEELKARNIQEHNNAVKDVADVALAIAAYVGVSQIAPRLGYSANTAASFALLTGAFFFKRPLHYALALHYTVAGIKSGWNHAYAGDFLGAVKAVSYAALAYTSTTPGVKGFVNKCYEFIPGYETRRT